MQREKQARLLQFQRDVKKRVQCLDKLKKQQQLQSNLNAVSLCNTISVFNLIWPNKIISVFRVTGLKILGRFTALIFIFIYFFLEERILCILKGSSPFKMHKIIYFSRKPEKNSRFHH